MQLKSVTACNIGGTELPLPLGDSSQGFVVSKIEGLGPVKATLASSTFANMDGEQYHSGRREVRNITLFLSLVPNRSLKNASDLRLELYSFFMPKSQVTLKLSLVDKFETNTVLQNQEFEIIGRVESFEVTLFDAKPAVAISILCYSPDLVDMTPVTETGSSVSDLTETTITYDGSVPAGVVFTLYPNRSITEFTIYQVTPENKLHAVYYSGALENNETIEISSLSGDKYVTHTASGVATSRLYALSPQSDWLELTPGNNTFRVYIPGDPISWDLVYYNKYGGI